MKNILLLFIVFLGVIQGVPADEAYRKAAAIAVVDALKEKNIAVPAGRLEDVTKALTTPQYNGAADRYLWPEDCGPDAKCMVPHILFVTKFGGACPVVGMAAAQTMEDQGPLYLFKYTFVTEKGDVFHVPFLNLWLEKFTEESLFAFLKKAYLEKEKEFCKK
jgi:hypothetical protein